MKRAATGNYSYRVRAHARRPPSWWAAYAFVDPIFSSGVLLGMNSGVLARRPSTLGW